jgi:3-dehydroquinate dehydratase/shikimate dehydrogenase
MWPDIQNTPVDAIPPTVRLVFDAIYNPSMTRFLTMGRDRGLVVITGVEMYAQQAVEQIRLLTGIRVSAAQVRRRFEIASAALAPGTGKVRT